MAAGSYGTIVRVSPSRPRLKVYRGYDPNEPTVFQKTAPVASDVDGAGGTTIWSGQLIYLADNAQTGVSEWKLLDQTQLALGSVPYFALQDAGATPLAGTGDPDVACTGLTGLSCAGDYELGTGFYDTGETYAVDTPLTADGTAGSIQPATGSMIVIGFVSAPPHGIPKDGTLLASPDGTPTIDLTNRESTASNQTILPLTTNFQKTVV